MGKMILEETKTAQMPSHNVCPDEVKMEHTDLEKAMQPKETTTPRKLNKAVFSKVANLEPAEEGPQLARGLNLIVKVGSTNVVLDRKRTDGTSLKIVEAQVGDDSGSIIMTARNGQTDLLKTGETLIIRNCKVEMFKGHLRLAVDQWGLIEISPQKFEGDVNQRNNLSATEYELVDQPLEASEAAHTS